MVAAAVILGALAWGDHPVLPLIAGVVALHNPVPGLVLVAVWIGRTRLLTGRGPTPDDEARFLEGIVTELHGGASPRQAVIRAADRDPTIRADAAVRAAMLGLDSQSLSRALSDALPLNGRLAGGAWAIANDVGAPFAPVMRVLAERASSRGRLRREQRGLTAQARATAWIVAGIPLLLVGLLAVTGRISLGRSMPVAVLGLSLQLVGIALVVLMLRSKP